MINSSLFLDKCKENGITLFTGTPCSYLKPFINTVIDDAELDFIETTNEGDAVALASGAWLGGQTSIVMFQNSGLGNAVNPITSLSYTMKIPFIGIVTLRGEVGGANDEPQHELMGKITTDLLEMMEVKWDYFPTKAEEVESSLLSALKYCNESNLPFFYVMKKDSVEAYELKSKNYERNLTPKNIEVLRKLSGNISATRFEALSAIKNEFDQDSVLLATTGKTGRELFTIEDSLNQLYMVGSMGCALPLGLGLSKSKFTGKVCVIDGDGALLMRLGNMALAGQMKAQNICHVLLDNGVHDSTGGQQTFSEGIDFALIAKACGYDYIVEVDTIEEFTKEISSLKNFSGLAFVRFVIKSGSLKDLGRPTVTPKEVAHRLKRTLQEY